jgi:hypothetical protein
MILTETGSLYWNLVLQTTDWRTVHRKVSRLMSGAGH